VRNASRGRLGVNTGSWPAPTEASAPYWNGLNERCINIQRCISCRRWIFYPRLRCSYCLSNELEWRRVSGDASLLMYTVLPQASSAATPSPEDMILGVAELAEGVRLNTILVNIPREEVVVRMPLTPHFHRSDQSAQTLLYFSATQY
jgi:uncharacterized OB-fold protein